MAYYSSVKKSTCFKNPDKTSIDLILTNQPSCFQHSTVFETDLSPFQLLTITEFNLSFQKLQPKIMKYRDHKNFDNEKFQFDIWKMTLSTDLEGFKKTASRLFNKHAPITRKYIRANEALFTTKELRKASMKRSKLRNKFLKSRIRYITKKSLSKTVKKPK